MRIQFRLPPAALLPLVVLGIPLTACATPRAGGLEVAQADRWENSNRRVYAFNKKVDRYAYKPVTNVYRAVVPKVARRGISNAYSNYGEPANFLNSLLQGKIAQAFRTFDRFLLNTTLGIGGLFDVATGLGRPQQSEDFGQTFAQWGIKSGPYVVLPFFGPSTLRDGVGLPFDFVIDPADFGRNALLSPSWYWRGGQIAGRLIDVRSRLIDAGSEGLLADSLDEYTLVKSAYLQRRRDQIWDGSPPQDPSDISADDLTPASELGVPAPETVPAVPEPATAPPPPQ